MNFTCFRLLCLDSHGNVFHNTGLDHSSFRRAARPCIGHSDLRLALLCLRNHNMLRYNGIDLLPILAECLVEGVVSINAFLLLILVDEVLLIRLSLEPTNCNDGVILLYDLCGFCQNLICYLHRYYSFSLKTTVVECDHLVPTLPDFFIRTGHQETVDSNHNDCARSKCCNQGDAIEYDVHKHLPPFPRINYGSYVFRIYKFLTLP
nr:MAG TPA: hypothetical protein [Caudoviricetes sp.]